MSTILGLVLAQLVSQVAVTKSEQVSAERLLSRTRGTIAAAGGASLFQVAPVPLIENFGLVGEVSSLFEDRFSVGAQLSVVTNRNVGYWDFGVGVALNYALSERWWVGSGLALHLISAGDLGGQFNCMAPVRVAFAFWGRTETKVTRDSLFLALEVAAGVATPLAGGRSGIAPRPPPGPVPAGSALLSLGYAWW